MTATSFHRCVLGGCVVLSMASIACRNPVVIERLQITPPFVCTGESIHFDWSIRNVSGIEIRTPSGQVFLQSSNRTGTWDSPPVQAGWDFLSLRGCKGSRCETHFYDVQIADNPKWTCPYFYDTGTADVQVCGSIQPNGRFDIVGEEPVVDYVHPLPSQSQDGLFAIYRLVTGYRYSIPASHFSPRIRVLQVKPGRLFNAILGMNGPVDPDGMFVAAVGQNAVARTWVPKGQSFTLPNPIAIAAAPWQLDYAQPTQIVVGTQYGGPPEPPDKADQNSTSIGLYPSVEFQVKCDVPPSP